MPILQALCLATVLILAGCHSMSGNSEIERDHETLSSGASLETRLSDPAVAFANARVNDGIVYTEGYFEHDGVTLHYVEAGQGELIIFYHGFPSFWYYFYDQMEAFKSRYRVVAVDALGAGLSDKPDDLTHYRAAALADHVDQLAQHLAGEAKFTLVGHDWGGALAMAFAEDRPERLHAVASFNAPSMNVFLDLLRSNEVQRERSKYMAVMSATSQQAVRESPPGDRIWSESYGGPLARGEISKAEYDLFGAALRPAAASNGGFNWYRANVPLPDEIGDGDFWPSPRGSIDIPALLVWGSEDRTFVLDFIEDMRANVPDLQVEVINGANHWSSMTHPDISNQAIQRLLVRAAREN
ncbi:MAG: alpha/beta hydrolase [Pseudomonadota bacterium]